MTSKIYFYKTALTPEKNAWIENINDFLITEGFGEEIYSEEEFQYQKIGYNLDVVVEATQTTVGNGSLGNYCRINQDGRDYYFFVAGVEWASQRAVRVSLVMDTINTYGEDLVFSPKTTIIREHRDRLHLQAGQTPGFGNKALYRIIDREAEQLDVPKEKEGGRQIIESIGNMDWYLIYKTRDNLTPENNANPIECDLIAEKPLLIHAAKEGPEYRWDASQLENGKYYYLESQTSPEISFEVHQGSSPALHRTWNNHDNKYIVFRFWREGNNIHGDSLIYTDTKGAINETGKGLDIPKDTTYLVFKLARELKVSNKLYTGFTDITNIYNRIELSAGSNRGISTIGIDSVDKTDSKLMKIIRLPYAPVEVRQNSAGEYIFPNSWKYEQHMMRLQTQNLSEEFHNQITDLNLNGILALNVDIQPTTLRNIHYESKMYHSEFYTYKCVYDSFAHALPLENFVITPYYGGENIIVPVSFKPTNTVNSKFAFRFNTGWNDEVFYADTSDYEDYMIVDRNNEETIFSNDYINYIRNGYNYDRKQQRTALFQSLLGTAVGVGGAAAQAHPLFGSRGREFNQLKSAVSHLTEHPDKLGAQHHARQMVRSVGQHNTLSWSLLVGTSINAANAAISTAFSWYNSEQAIQQKLRELSQQSTQVSGSDDVDLLKYYNNNRLSVMTYDTKPLIKQNIFNLFYYAGYSHPTQEVPTLLSRYWFNYVQCDPIFKNEEMSVYNNYLDDIKERFNNGVTVYHHHPGVGSEWDMEQKYENWETSLVK